MSPKYAEFQYQHDQQVAAHPYPHTPHAVRSVLAEVVAERQRQDTLFGVQDHPNGTGHGQWFLRGTPLPTSHAADMPTTMGVLAYTARNVTDQAARSGTITWADILTEEVGESLAESDPDRLRTELIQVAAVAVAWAEQVKINSSRDRRRAAEIVGTQGTGWRQ